MTSTRTRPSLTISANPSPGEELRARVGPHGLTATGAKTSGVIGEGSGAQCDLELL